MQMGLNKQYQLFQMEGDKMKKSLYGAMAITAGLCSSVAMADVVVYGIVDTGVEYLTNTNVRGTP
jgi:predicted porin